MAHDWILQRAFFKHWHYGALVCLLAFLPSYLSPFPLILSLWWVPDSLSCCVGTYGWVERICQQGEQSPSRNWLPIVEAPPCCHAPNKINDTTTKREKFTLQICSWDSYVIFSCTLIQCNQLTAVLSETLPCARGVLLAQWSECHVSRIIIIVDCLKLYCLKLFPVVPTHAHFLASRCKLSIKGGVFF